MLRSSEDQNIIDVIMKTYKIIILVLITVLSACKTKEQTNTNIVTEEKKVEVQGHRGDRGNFPENSIPAFLSAVKKGADVIELDVVVSKDNKVVVSHEPFMHSNYVLTPMGKSISHEEQQNYNLYQMNYDSIKHFDSGSKGNRSFPDQKKQRTYKPLLNEVIDTIENYVQTNNLNQIKYNIELKSSSKNYGIYQPEPNEFLDLVMKIITEKEIETKISIQSFDVSILNLLHLNYPQVESAYLVTGEGIEKNLALLNFVPDIYSPNYKLVKNQFFVDSIKEKKMRIIPWTVNENDDIVKMLSLKVDGIITDYPERVLEKR